MLMIGFGSRARQGKDTAAEAIKNYYDAQSISGRRRIKVGIFKYATALYQEVNKFLSTEGGQRWLAKDSHVRYMFTTDPSENNAVQLPDWVQPEQNPQISDLAPYGKHPKLLQFWGTDYRRQQDPDYWVKKLFETIPANLDIALVSDVRFPNEFDGIKQRGGYLVNVQRLRLDGKPFLADDRPADHVSETAVDDYNWDFYIKSKHPWVTKQTAITLAEGLLDETQNKS